LNVSGGLSTDTATINWWNGTGYENDGLFFPDLSSYSNLVSPNGSATFGNLSVTHDAWVNSDLVLQGNLITNENALSFAYGDFGYGSLDSNTSAIAFNNTSSQSTTVWMQGSWWYYWPVYASGEQMLLDAQGRLTITSRWSGGSVGNTFTFNPADMEMDFHSQALGTGRLHLQDYNAGSAMNIDTQDMLGGSNITYIHDGSITLDATNPASPALTLGQISITGDGSSGGLSMYNSGTGSVLDINPGNQSLTFQHSSNSSRSFSIAGNNTMGNFLRELRLTCGMAKAYLAGLAGG